MYLVQTLICLRLGFSITNLNIFVVGLPLPTRSIFIWLIVLGYSNLIYDRDSASLSNLSLLRAWMFTIYCIYIITCILPAQFHWNGFVEGLKVGVEQIWWSMLCRLTSWLVIAGHDQGAATGRSRESDSSLAAAVGVLCYIRKYILGSSRLEQSAVFIVVCNVRVL